MRGLRTKMVASVFASALIVFAFTFLVIGIGLQVSVQNRLDGMTELIELNGGEFPVRAQYEALEESGQLLSFKFTEESPYRVRYFTVSFDDGGQARVSIEHIASVDSSHGEQMAKEVLALGIQCGYSGDYRYRVSADGKSVIFFDCASELDSIRSTLRVTSIVEAIVVLLITLAFLLLSDRIIQPFEANARAQRQFITDASHELKTPVAIISANAEVLAYKYDGNEWVDNIVSQTEKMGYLIDELLTLSRLDEADAGAGIEAVDLSRIVVKAVGDFDELFNKHGAAVSLDVPDELVVNGNPDQLRRLVSVLVENASKYVEDGGDVEVKLSRGGRFTTLSVFNECVVSPDVDYAQLFDRFYRPDSSRASETGGHGIGLSIAKRIAELHGGDIAATPSERGMTFTVRLSNKLRPAVPAAAEFRSGRTSHGDVPAS